MFIGLKSNSEKITLKRQNETQPGSEDAGYRKLNPIHTKITGMESSQQTSLLFALHIPSLLPFTIHEKRETNRRRRDFICYLQYRLRTSNGSIFKNILTHSSNTGLHWAKTWHIITSHKRFLRSYDIFNFWWTLSLIEHIMRQTIGRNYFTRHTIALKSSILNYQSSPIVKDFYLLRYVAAEFRKNLVLPSLRQLPNNMSVRRY